MVRGYCQELRWPELGVRCCFMRTAFCSLANSGKRWESRCGRHEPGWSDRASMLPLYGAPTLMDVFPLFTTVWQDHTHRFGSRVSSWDAFVESLRKKGSSIFCAQRLSFIERSLHAGSRY